MSNQNLIIYKFNSLYHILEEVGLDLNFNILLAESENSLNDKIKKLLNSLEINDYTRPIKVSGGFLVLKLNDLKIVQKKIDPEQELKKRIRSLKNEQLNQYSKMHFNKVKKDIRINEI